MTDDGFFDLVFFSCLIFLDVTSSSTLLHRFEVHRQAVVVPDSSSVISLSMQESFGFKGLCTDPRTTEVLKHSLIVAENESS